MKKSTLSKILWLVTITAIYSVISWRLYLLINPWLSKALPFPRGLMASLFALPLFVYLWAMLEVVVVDSEFINYTHGRYWLAFGRAVLWTISAVMTACLLIVLVQKYF